MRRCCRCPPLPQPGGAGAVGGWRVDPHLGDVDVEIADRIALELLPYGLVTLDIRQPADAVALQADAMKIGSNAGS